MRREEYIASFDIRSRSRRFAYRLMLLSDSAPMPCIEAAPKDTNIYVLTDLHPRKAAHSIIISRRCSIRSARKYAAWTLSES